MSRFQGQWGSGQRGSGGGGGGGAKQSSPDWREVVRTDRRTAERPEWLLSCYGHEREGPNDITGDVSPEEVRWANLVAGQRGATQRHLAAEFKAAEHAKIEQFQALMRAPRAPSKGGPPLPALGAGISNLEWVAGTVPAAPAALGNSSPFGQPAQPSSAPRAFGQPLGSTASFAAQPVAAAPAPFGQPAAAATGVQRPFGGVQQPLTGGFGGGFGGVGSTAGFGGAFGSTQAAKPSFGQSPQQGIGSIPFGGGGGFGSTPFGAGPAAAPRGFGSSAFGAVVPGATAFGQQPAGAAFGLAAGAPFPQAAAAGPLDGAALQHAAATGVVAASDANTDSWRAAAFEKGKIPEHAPPAMYCQG